MELSKELKEKVQNAKSAEEAKKILEEAGITLDDAELNQVAGGGAYDERRGEIGNWHFV